MSKKPSLKGGGAKGTPAPARYGPDAPPLPPFSINWTAVGIGVENVEEGLSPARVIELVNAGTLPGLGTILVDAQEMAEEEMLIADSQLGSDLKTAKKDFTDRKGDPTKENWVTPEFLQKLIAVRSSVDQAFQHREEEVRRAAALTSLKQAIEDAKASVGDAETNLQAAKNAAQEQKEKLTVEAEKEAKEAADAGQPPPPPNAELETELLRLEQLATDAERNLEEAEEEVAASVEAEKLAESSLLMLYKTGRIYWCLGLGPGSEYVASLGAGSVNTFGAVFNMVPEYVLEVPEGTPEQEANQPPVEMPPVPVPQLISELRAIREAADLAGPSRQVGVIDVMYEKPFDKDFKNKKGPADDNSLPYEEIAIAFAASAKRFLQQFRDYQVIRDNAVHVPVPDAVPNQDVDLSCYRRLLSLVPVEMIGVPVIIYCMVEQVAYKPEDCHVEETSSRCKTVESAMKKSFLRTGHEVFGMELSEITGCCKIGTSQGKERLVVVHEHDRVSNLAAGATKDLLESTTKWSLPSSLDALDVERKMVHLLPTPGRRRWGMPPKPGLTEERKGAYETALNTISRGFFSKLERTRKLGIFSDMLAAHRVPSDAPFEVQAISERYHLERFSDTVLGQVYASSRLILPFQSVHYDEDDDCLLVALHIREGEHMWNHQINCQVPFGDFCNASWASQIPMSRHLSYGVERSKGLALEKMWFFFTKGSALARCGLPAAHSLRSAAQATVYKDENMFLLREMVAGSDERCFIACLRDGYVLYIYPSETGSLKLQVTSPTSRTFEVSAAGEVLLFPPKECDSKCNDTGADEQPSSAGEGSNEAKELLNCTSSVVEILKKEQGDFEHWRCVLPSGTIVRYLSNGDCQLCFANGNVSKWHLEPSGDSSWETTNNKGETTAHFQREEPPPAEEPPKPSVVTMPTKKCAEMSDADTGVSISTREDLVVIVTSDEDHTRLVQHADGSQIFSTVFKEQVETSGVDSAAVEGADNQQADRSEDPGTIMKTVAWSAKKEGFPVVHGSGGDSVKVDFKTSWGLYRAGWSKEKQQLTVELPCGSLIFSEGSTVSLRPSDFSEPGTKDSNTQSDAADSQSGIRNWESKNFHLGDEFTPGSPSASINTGEQYVFDLIDGSVRHTDLEGNGFIAHKGTSADIIVNGSIKEQGEDDLSTKSNPSTNTPEPDTLQLDPDPADQVEENPEIPAPELNIAQEENVEVPEGELVEAIQDENVDVPGGEIVDVPPESNVDTNWPPLTKCPRWYAGPAARLFAFYEGGHGYEILDKYEVEIYRKAKHQTNCHYASSKITGDEEEALFHIYATLSEKELCRSSSSDSSVLCMPFQNADCAGVFDLSQRDFNLPRAICPPKTGSQLECKVMIVRYRQILEYPSYRPKNEQGSLSFYASLKNLMRDIPTYVPKLPDSSTCEAVHKQNHVSSRIKQGLAAQRLQDAKNAAAWERRLVEDIITSLALAREQHSLSASEQELRRKRDMLEEFRAYLRTRTKMTCFHKPTNLLQKEGPFRPTPESLLLYFKSEEGLRALLCRFSKYKEENEDSDIEDVRIQVNLEESTTHLKVDLVPIIPPVTVRFRDVPGARRARMELRAHDASPEEYRPVQVTLRQGRLKPVVLKLQVNEAAVKAHKDRFLRVQFEEGRRGGVKVDLLAENQLQEISGLPLPGAYHQRNEGPSPVKANLHDTEKGVKVELTSKDILVDDLNPKRKIKPHKDSKTVQEKPVKVRLRTYGTAVEVGLFPEDVLMTDIKTVPEGPFPPLRVFIGENAKGEGATVEMLPVDLSKIKEEKPPNYRPVRYGNEAWVPREHQRLSYPRPDSVLWSEEETDGSLRISSSKAVWYPNEHYLAARDVAKPALRTTSMSLTKKLRPMIDRPQFSIFPDVVNFRKMKFGTSAMQGVAVYNYHSDFCRFKVASQDECIRVVYEHGPLAAGMSRRLKICFKASRPGEFNGKVHIETEFDIFVLPVLANVLLI